METRWATADMAGHFKHVTITDGQDDPLRAVSDAVARMKAGGLVHTEIILNVIPPDRLPLLVRNFETATQGMQSKTAVLDHAWQMIPCALRDLLGGATQIPSFKRQPIFVQDKFRGKLHVDLSRKGARLKISAGIYFAGEGMVVDTRPVHEIMTAGPDSEGVPRWDFIPGVELVERHPSQIVTPPGSVVICREQAMHADSDWTLNDPPSPHASGCGARLGFVFW